LRLQDVVLREDGKVVPKKSDFGTERVWIFAKIEFEDGKKSENKGVSNQNFFLIWKTTAPLNRLTALLTL